MCEKLAKEFDCEVTAIQAVAQTESGDGGHFKNGLPKILFHAMLQRRQLEIAESRISLIHGVELQEIQDMTRMLLGLLLLITQQAWGNDLLMFDDPRIMVVRNKHGQLSGYYVGRSNQSYLFAGQNRIYVCKFLFDGLLTRFDEAKVDAFGAALERPPSSRLTPGVIHIDASTWRFQFSDTPKGCGSKMDGDQFAIRSATDADPVPIRTQGLPARVTGVVPVVGIRVSRQAATLSTRPDARGTPTREVAPGDVVLAISTRNEHTLMRRIDDQTGEVTEGWIKSAVLANPFSMR